ncbi:PREDICTED: proton-coupled amino acid transporter 1-like [Priapulus caudatus]|uniref:Proton-coupled amino acid transporter 1-like n=1 Tax=Priapulus caudatus TaxID=37621 RepID=A0ABM1ETB4_PRICU|nr:PREDICTED: proton-coupled amino acid transporter 1-like [Priapulus caudatus]
MFAAVIFITYALQFYVAMEIMWPPLRNRIANEDRHLVWELIFRVILVSLTFLLAVAIPDLSLFISLVGAAASSSLALIFPPILDVVAFWDEMSSLRFIKNFLILIFGLVGFITGTAVSIQQIIRTFA